MVQKVETVETMETVETVEFVETAQTEETEDLKKVTHLLSDNLKARDASASKNLYLRLFLHTLCLHLI